jgi:hypothetical protein
MVATRGGEAAGVGRLDNDMEVHFVVVVALRTGVWPESFGLRGLEGPTADLLGQP